MVIFTETMAKLISELADKSLKVTVSEDTITFDFTAEAGRMKTSSSVKKAAPRRKGKVYTFNGETHTVREWAEKYSIPYKTMAGRLKNGSPETKFRRGKGPRRVIKKG